MIKYMKDYFLLFDFNFQRNLVLQLEIASAPGKEMFVLGSG